MYFADNIDDAGSRDLDLTSDKDQPCFYFGRLRNSIRFDRGVSKTQLAEFGTDYRSVIPNSFDNYTRHFVSSGSGGELIINSSVIFGT